MFCVRDIFEYVDNNNGNKNASKKYNDNHHCCQRKNVNDFIIINYNLISFIYLIV
jgi:hypothetical protein